MQSSQFDLGGLPGGVAQQILNGESLNASDQGPVSGIIMAGDLEVFWQLFIQIPVVWGLGFIGGSVASLSFSSKS